MKAPPEPAQAYPTSNTTAAGRRWRGASQADPSPGGLPIETMPALALDALINLVGGFALGYAVAVRRRKAGAGGSKAKKAPQDKAAAGGGARPKATPVPRPREELKMVLCVNQSLKMGTGKVGAQCAHAAVGVLQAHYNSHVVAMRQWEMHGQPKIALKVQDEVEMAGLEAKAQAAGMPTYIVHDAGRTQIAAGSQTVLAIGPAPKSQLDAITGHLRLL